MAKTTKRSTKRTMKKSTGRPPKKRPVVRPSKGVDYGDPEEPEPKGAKVSNESSSVHQDATSWISAITTAIGDFDFKRCAELYELMDWTWGMDGKAIVPSEEDIRKQVNELIKDAVEGVVKCPEPETSYFCATGGLCVRAWKAPDPNDNFIWIGFVPVDTMM